MQNPEHSFRTREILNFARHLMRDLIGWYPKKGKVRVQQKLKVSIVDIQLNRSVIRKSNSKVFSSGVKTYFLLNPGSISFQFLLSSEVFNQFQLEIHGQCYLGIIQFLKLQQRVWIYVLRISALSNHTEVSNSLI